MKTKITKESRNLLIAMLIGDGTICNNNSFKLSHCEAQLDYLEWKVKLLNERGIRNNGVRRYVASGSFKPGVTTYYTQLNIIPFIKLLRRIVYTPKKNYCNRRLLNRLSAQGIAIWYMDDGHINHRITKSTNKCHGFYIRISTCEAKENVQILIKYFREEWNINFYTFKEGRGYSLICGTSEGLKFIEIVKPYVMQVPSMIHKIQFDLSQRRKPLRCVGQSVEMQNTINGKEIVYSSLKDEV